MFEDLLEREGEEPMAVLFSDRFDKRCAVRSQLVDACEDLGIEMFELDPLFESPALHLLEVSSLPAVVLISGGMGWVVAGNGAPVVDIRLQLIAAGVRLP